MISLKQFFADHVRYFCEMFRRDAEITGIKEVARRSVARFLGDLKNRMEARIDEIDPEEIAETVVGWFANISASVPNENDEKGVEEAGASDAEFKLDFGPIHIDTKPPKPMPPIPPDRRHRRPGPPPPPHYRPEPPRPPKPRR